jgi:hypothetical protein
MPDYPFGPEYPKIHTAFKRDERGVIIPDELTTDEFAFLFNAPWQWTEKVDGTNIRLHWNGEAVTIGGRTDNAQLPKPLVERLRPVTYALDLWRTVFSVKAAEQDGPRLITRRSSGDVTIYGEGYGAKIQKGGGRYRPDQDFIVFDVRIGPWWLDDEAVRGIAAALGFEVVPALGVHSLRTMVDVMVDGVDVPSRWPNVAPEGFVGRPVVDLYDRAGRRIQTKLKYKDFEDLKRRGPSQTAELVV